MHTLLGVRVAGHSATLLMSLSFFLILIQELSGFWFVEFNPDVVTSSFHCG